MTTSGFCCDASSDATNKKDRTEPGSSEFYLRFQGHILRPTRRSLAHLWLHKTTAQPSQILWFTLSSSITAALIFLGMLHGRLLGAGWAWTVAERNENGLGLEDMQCIGATILHLRERRVCFTL
jgi:hypothetical protein